MVCQKIKLPAVRFIALPPGVFVLSAAYAEMAWKTGKVGGTFFSAGRAGYNRCAFSELAAVTGNG